MTQDPDRRYSEAEVEKILEEATEAQATGRGVPDAGGITLADLQEIAGEVGISRDLITRAAARLDRAPDEPAAAPQRFAGVPIAVGRTFHLDRAPTDQEWQRLVVDMREAFAARGTLSEEGGFRQWHNGNLQALLEPVDGGYRLRLKSLKSSARAGLTAGLFWMGFAPLMLVALLANRGGSLASFILSGLVGGIGAAAYGATRFSTTNWARLRERQFEDLGKRLLASMAKTDAADPLGRELRPGDQAALPAD